MPKAAKRAVNESAVSFADKAASIVSAIQIADEKSDDLSLERAQNKLDDIALLASLSKAKTAQEAYFQISQVLLNLEHFDEGKNSDVYRRSDRMMFSILQFIEGVTGEPVNPAIKGYCLMADSRFVI